MDLKREIRLADLSPQARIAVVVVLAAAALALATFMLVHARGTSSSDSATPVAKPVVRAPHRPVAARSALPANVSGALHAGSAVVVALYAPNVEPTRSRSRRRRRARRRPAQPSRPST